MRAQRRFGGQDEQLELSVYMQVEMLLQIFSTEVVEHALKVQAALDNYKKCTLQKGFIALLTHMMEKVAGATESVELGTFSNDLPSDRRVPDGLEPNLALDDQETFGDGNSAHNLEAPRPQPMNANPSLRRSSTH